jgi:sialic acid synthase SpsE
VMLGSGTKAPSERELANSAIVRKSLVAGAPIRAGEPFSAANLVLKRPGTGRPPRDYWALLGKTAARAYAEDEPID